MTQVAGEIGEQLLFGALDRSQGALETDRVDEPAHVGFEDVVLRCHLVAQLAARMRLAHVVGLQERLHRCLPVARQPLADVGLDVAVLEIEHGEVVGKHAEVLLQRLRLLVEVDPDETGEDTHGHLGQVMRVAADVREVPSVRQVDQLAGERIRPTMKRASQLFGEAASARATELRAAMHTRVEVGLDRSVAGAHDQRTVTADVVHEVVTGLAKMVHVTRPLPRRGPHVFVLGTGETG